MREHFLFIQHPQWRHAYEQAISMKYTDTDTDTAKATDADTNTKDTDVCKIIAET